MGWRRVLLGAALLYGVASAALLYGFGAEPSARYAHGPAAPENAAGEAVLSLFALGDTGEYAALPALRSGQLSVARGMEALDRQRPVDALVLLGDNFYPVGLAREALVERLRQNLVGPYCRFADLSGRRSPEVAGSCTRPAGQRHPVPLYAVLGNHDLKTAESAALEREALPDFLPNWHMPAGVVEAVELPGGLSLVLVQSPELKRLASAETLREALARSRGPWRIVATHHPSAPRPGAPDPYKARMREAIAASGVPVQLLLAGHHHNLQVLMGEAPQPALQVIAGGGSNRKPFRDPPLSGRRFGVETTGFARVDLLGTGEAQRLVVSLYTVPRYPVFFWVEAKLVSRWQVDRAGVALQEWPAGKSTASASASSNTP